MVYNVKYFYTFLLIVDHALDLLQYEDTPSSVNFWNEVT